MKDFQVEIKKEERDEFREFCINHNVKVDAEFGSSSISSLLRTILINSDLTKDCENVYVAVRKDVCTYYISYWRPYVSNLIEGAIVPNITKTFDEFKQLFNKTSNLELSKVEKDDSVVSKLIVKHFFKQTLTKQNVVDFIKDYEETI